MEVNSLYFVFARGTIIIEIIFSERILQYINTILERKNTGNCIALINLLTMLIQCEFMIRLNTSACTMCCYTTNHIISCYFKHLLDIPTSQFLVCLVMFLSCVDQRDARINNWKSSAQNTNETLTKRTVTARGLNKQNFRNAWNSWHGIITL